MMRHFPITTAAIRRLVRNWRILRAIRALQKAMRLAAELGDVSAVDEIADLIERFGEDVPP